MSLYDEFNNLSIDSIHKYVKEGAAEDLQLEFKTVGDASLKPADRKNLARVLSGFSNSAGGIVVWGVDARKNEDDIDCAVDLRPIDNIARFVSRLNELTPQAASPVLDGVEHKAIRNGESGFAATFVPESDVAPHMAVLGAIVSISIAVAD